jgi:very-short-patch-repair endonuclease
MTLLHFLKESFDGATIIHGTFRGPKTEFGGQTHFDFHVTFSDGFEIIIELDGDQHFWRHNCFFSAEGCLRDLKKEIWANNNGLSVVRLLQTEVYSNKGDWKTLLRYNIDAARNNNKALVFTTSSPEYRSSESAYVQLRK